MVAQMPSKHLVQIRVLILARCEYGVNGKAGLPYTH